MPKYLLLKHYRGAPASVNDVPMEQWTPEEVSAHLQYMRDFAARLGVPIVTEPKPPTSFFLNIRLERFEVAGLKNSRKCPTRSP